MVEKSIVEVDKLKVDEEEIRKLNSSGKQRDGVVLSRSFLSSGLCVSAVACLGADAGRRTQFDEFVVRRGDGSQTAATGKLWVICH